MAIKDNSHDIIRTKWFSPHLNLVLSQLLWITRWGSGTNRDILGEKFINNPNASRKWFEFTSFYARTLSRNVWSQISNFLAASLKSSMIKSSFYEEIKTDCRIPKEHWRKCKTTKAIIVISGVKTKWTHNYPCQFPKWRSHSKQKNPLWTKFSSPGLLRSDKIVFWTPRLSLRSFQS